MSQDHRNIPGIFLILCPLLIPLWLLFAFINFMEDRFGI